MKKLFAILALPLLLSFAGCPSVGVPSPVTFKEKLSAAYVTNTAIRETSVNLLSAKKIGSDDAENIMKQNDNFRAGLDIARKLSGSDLSAADAKLTAVRTGLTALQAYLATRQ